MANIAGKFIGGSILKKLRVTNCPVLSTVCHELICKPLAMRVRMFVHFVRL